ncbi:MAG: class I SAM-dependent methyltransferase [Planctomycetota bacterium]
MAKSTSTTRGARKAGKKRSGTARRERGLSLAAKADRHVCYQQSVQCVEAEIDFVDETFKDLRGRRLKQLREDFGGTGNTSCEWVRRHTKAEAIVVDLDSDPLEWGREHNIGALKPGQRKRIKLVQADVRDVTTPKVDAVLAMNFSWMIFKHRDMLRTYFERVRQSLVKDGVLFMDAYGGYESFKEIRDKRTINKDLTYVWDQHRYDPITGEMDCFIHFHFRDGSKLNKAFEYSWRLWTLPELREILDEAGFRRSTVYWEGTDEDTGEGNGEYEPAEHGDADPAWVSYVVAEK